MVIIMTVKNPVANKINFLGTLETSQRADSRAAKMFYDFTDFSVLFTM